MPENVSSAETPPEEFCHGCRYWQLIGDEFLDGECRRHAPRLSGMAAPHGDAIHQDPKWAMWPTTFRDDWCGEFAPNLYRPSPGEKGLRHDK